jgi:hypothetical protein
MLLQIQKTAIRMMEVGFFSMPKFILKYDLENFNISLNNTKFTYTCFAITTLFVLNIGLGSLYVALTYFCGSRENVDFTQAIIQIINALMALVTVFGIVFGLPKISKKLPLINHILSQCQLNFKRNLYLYKYTNIFFIIVFIANNLFQF